MSSSPVYTERTTTERGMTWKTRTSSAFARAAACRCKTRPTMAPKPEAPGSEEYCTYCYQNGGFTADCTMDEMIDFCIRFEQQQNPGLDAEDAAAPCARGTPRSSAGSRRRADAYAARAPARAGEGTVRENTAPPRPHELHTTPLGAARLCKNLGFAPQDVMRQCIRCIAQPDAVYQRGAKTGISPLRTANLWSTRAAGRH